MDSQTQGNSSGSVEKKDEKTRLWTKGGFLDNCQLDPEEILKWRLSRNSYWMMMMQAPQKMEKEAMTTLLALKDTPPPSSSSSDTAPPLSTSHGDTSASCTFGLCGTFKNGGQQVLELMKLNPKETGDGGAAAELTPVIGNTKYFSQESSNSPLISNGDANAGTEPGAACGWGPVQLPKGPVTDLVAYEVFLREQHQIIQNELNKIEKQKENHAAVKMDQPPTSPPATSGVAPTNGADDGNSDQMISISGFNDSQHLPEAQNLDHQESSGIDITPAISGISSDQRSTALLGKELENGPDLVMESTENATPASNGNYDIPNVTNSQQQSLWQAPSLSVSTSSEMSISTFPMVPKSVIKLWYPPKRKASSKNKLSKFSRQSTPTAAIGTPTIALSKRRSKPDKPYNCNFCDQSFTSKRSLFLHIRKHATANPFQCKQCFRVFSQNSDINSHKQRGNCA